jgi:GT2 family glycosyltransferase
LNLVSVITVNYNQPKVTEALLESLFRFDDYPLREIIVVDNGSTIDHTPEWRVRYPEVSFLRSEVNLGFAGGNNLGIASAKGDYFFLVNNDTEVTPGLLGKLTATLDTTPDAGIVCPKIHYASQPGLIQYAGYTPMNFYTGRNACIGQYEPDRGQYDAASGPTGYAHGAAMMVRKEAVEKAGYMSTDYFLYYEEFDWCERIRKNGFRIYINTEALIYHKESVSVGKRSALKEYFMTRNRILFIRRNAALSVFMLFSIYYGLVVVPRNVFIYLKNGESELLKAFFKGIFWHFRHRPGSSELY